MGLDLGDGAAHDQSPQQQVVLFEAENRLGGHARTSDRGQETDHPSIPVQLVSQQCETIQPVKAVRRAEGASIAKSDMSFRRFDQWGQFGIWASFVGSLLFAQQKKPRKPKSPADDPHVSALKQTGLQVCDDPEIPMRHFLETARHGRMVPRLQSCYYPGAICPRHRKRSSDFRASNDP